MKQLKSFDIYDGKEHARDYDFVRVSRWITVKQNYNPNKGNALYDYAVDGFGNHSYSENFNPVENGGKYLDYFTFNGRNYAIEQFIAIGCVWDVLGHHAGYYENGEKHFISAYDTESYFNPLYIEWDECGERVRVYRESENKRG